MKLSNNEKQKTLYAALLRFSSDGRSLREKTIEHLIIIALEGTTIGNGDGVTTGDLRRKIGSGLGTEGIKVSLIQEALDRMESNGLIERGRVRHKSSAKLTPKGAKALEELSDKSEKLISKPINMLLKDYSAEFDLQKAEVIVKKFIVNCFVDYGHNIALNILGKVNDTDFSSTIDFDRIFAKSISSTRLSIEEIESLEDRCYLFLKNKDKEFVDLKFLLTQVFYVGKVLELDISDFDPIGEASFKNAIIYLDSNVILESIFDHDRTNFLSDLVRLVKRFSVQFYVTNETIEEINRVLKSRIKDLEKISENLPQELYEQTNDEFVNDFLTFQVKNPDGTPKEFMSEIGDIRDILEGQGITYVDAEVECDFDQRIVSDLSKEIDFIAKQIRGWGKSNSVANHDANHLLLVKKNRDNCEKSWFLSKDNTLLKLNSKVIPSSTPYIFSLSAFLQWISPFVEGSKFDSLENLFSNVMDGEILHKGASNLFDLSELNVIAEYHVDLMATDPKKLSMAFDYVKKCILDGKEINHENQHKVNFEIKKYIACNTDEEIQQLISEAERQKEKARREEENSKRLVMENIDLGADLSTLESSLGISKTKAIKSHRNFLIISIAIFLIGCFVSLFIWTYDAEISRAINAGFPESKNLIESLPFPFVKAIGSLFFMLSGLMLCSCFRNIKTGLITTLFAVSIYQSRIISTNTMDEFVSYADFAVFLILVILGVVHVLSSIFKNEKVQ